MQKQFQKQLNSALFKQYTKLANNILPTKGNEYNGATKQKHHSYTLAGQINSRKYFRYFI
jgi:hypothetical protein